MSSQLTLSFFPTRSTEGLALQRLFVPCAERLGFCVKTITNRSPLKYSEACANDDVVVLDASIERTGEHNYDIVTTYPLDHLLVVSRTYLPFNFYGLRDEIWDFDKNTFIYGTAFYSQTKSNQEIVRWLDLQLRDLLAILPRPASERGGPLAMARAMQPSLDKQDERRSKSGQIFISYRSKDDKKVEQVKRRLEAGNFPNMPRTKVRYFPPGMLSDEVMTEQRRWQILSMLDRFIGPASEVWIYETEDYYDSWWTIGELAILAYRKDLGYRGKQPPQLKILNPKTHEVYDASADFLPIMTEEQKKRRARWFSTADTAQGLELSAGIASGAQNPLLRWLPYYKDHVWKEEFWKYPMLDCGCCRQIGHRRNRFDVDNFLWSRDPAINRFTPDQLQAAIFRKSISCPNCGAIYRLEEAPPHYIYIGNMGIPTQRLFNAWKEIFGFQPSDPNETNLLKLPVYRLVQSNLHS